MVYVDEESEGRRLNLKFWLAVAIAGFLDMVDYLLVGLIPVAGDILDIIGVVVLFPLIGPYSFIGFTELIPVLGDLVPSFLVAVFLSRTNLLKGVLPTKMEA